MSPGTVYKPYDIMDRLLRRKHNIIFFIFEIHSFYDKLYS